MRFPTFFTFLLFSAKQRAQIEQSGVIQKEHLYNYIITTHPIKHQSPQFYSERTLDKEMFDKVCLSIKCSKSYTPIYPSFILVYYVKKLDNNNNNNN